MATESIITSPRLDRKFTDGQGNLTQNAYALLYQLIRRTGGVVGEVIDIAGIYDEIATAAATPINAPTFQDNSHMLADLMQPPPMPNGNFADVMQCPTTDPLFAETTWQI